MPRTNAVHQDGPGQIIRAAHIDDPDQYLAWLSAGTQLATEASPAGVGAAADAAGAVDCSSALAAKDAAGKLTIFPAGTYRVSAALAFAGAVRFLPGAKLSLDAGVTVTFNGPLHAGPQQIFAGAGTVVFGPGSVSWVLAEWWGAKADNSTNSTAPINSALATALPLLLSPGKYMASNLYYASGGAIRGAGMLTTYLRQIAGSTGPLLQPLTPSAVNQFLHISDLLLDGYPSRTTSGGLLLVQATQNATIERVFFNYANTYAVKFQGGGATGDIQTPRVLNCSFQNGTSGTVYVWLSASDTSKPDYCQIAFNDMESGAGVTGVKATIGPTSGPGVGAGDIACNTMVGVPTPFDLAALGLRVHANDIEAFASEGVTNITVYNKPGVWTGIDGPNLYCHNVYHWSGSFSGSRPVVFTDTAVLPATRMMDVEPQPGGSTNYSGVALPSFLSVDVPAASAMPRSLIYVSDAAAGSNVQFSTGSAWIALG